MRFEKISFMASTTFFMGVAMVLVGSVLKLVHVGLGGIPLWNAANATQAIGFIFASATFLLNVKTLMGNAKAEPKLGAVPERALLRQTGIRFAELLRNDPEPGRRDVLGDTLKRIDRRPEEVAHMSNPPSESDKRAHNRGALQTASEHCFAGSEGGGNTSE